MKIKKILLFTLGVAAVVAGLLALNRRKKWSFSPENRRGRPPIPPGV